MKKGMHILLALGLTAGVSMAQDEAMETDARRVAAEKLMNLMNMDDMFDESMDSYYAWARQQIAQSMADADEAEIDEAIQAMNKSFERSREYFAWDKLSPIFTDVYMDVFTAEELEGLIGFYESDIGKSFLEKQPQLMQATMERMQGLMQEMMMDLQEDMEKIMAGVDAGSLEDDGEPGDAAMPAAPAPAAE